MSKGVALSVVIVSHDSYPYIKTMIESLKEIDGSASEVIFLDAGSSDASASLIKEYCCFRDFATLYMLPNSSLGELVRFGASRALGEYVCFVGASDRISVGRLLNLAERCKDLESPDVLLTDVRYECGSARSCSGGYYANCLSDRSLYGAVFSLADYPRALNPLACHSAALFRKDFLEKRETLLANGASCSNWLSPFWYALCLEADALYALDCSFRTLVHFGEGVLTSPIESGDAGRFFGEYLILANDERQVTASEGCQIEVIAKAILRGYFLPSDCRRGYIMGLSNALQSSVLGVAEAGSSCDKWLLSHWKLICKDPDAYCQVLWGIPDCFTSALDSKDLTPSDGAKGSSNARDQFSYAAEVADLRDRLARLKQSNSYRIGRAVTALPRAAKRFCKRLMQ